METDTGEKRAFIRAEQSKLVFGLWQQSQLVIGGGEIKEEKGHIKRERERAGGKREKKKRGKIINEEKIMKRSVRRMERASFRCDRAKKKKMYEEVKKGKEQMKE